MRLALPAILEMMLHMAVSLVDVAMVGRLGADSLAAVSLGSQLIFTFVFVFAALGIGASAIIARAVGAQILEEADHVAGQVVTVSAITALGLGTVIFLFTEKIVSLFQVNAVVAQLAVSYLKIMSFSAVFFLVLLTGESICRSAGYTKIPLMVASVANTINIMGDYLLIFGKAGFPAMGVKGAALASSVSFFIAFVIILTILFSGKIPVRLHLNQMVPVNLATVRRILVLAIPAGLEELNREGSGLLVIYLLTGLGSVGYAAHQVAVSIESLSFMPGYGFAIAAGVLVGQSLGAQDPMRAERLAFKSTHLAAAIMTGMGLLFFFLNNWLVRIFTTDSAIIPLAALSIRIGAFEQTSIALEMVLVGALKGAGDTRFPMYLSMLGNWVIRVPLIYIALNILHQGLPAVWVITVFQWFVLGLLAWIRFRAGMWKAIVV